MLCVGLNDDVVAELEISEAARTTVSQQKNPQLSLSNLEKDSGAALSTYNTILEYGDNSGVGEVDIDSGTWVLDLYRRFIADFGVSVLGVERELYAALLKDSMVRECLDDEMFLSRAGLLQLIEDYKVREGRVE